MTVASLLAGLLGQSALAPTLAAAASSGYASAILGDQPTAYWRLGDSGGSPAQDASGNHHTGSFAGGVSQGAPGALANDPDSATSFDGVSGYMGDSLGLTVAPDFTIEAWVKAAPGAQGPIVSVSGASGTRTLSLLGNQFVGLADLSDAWPQYAVWSQGVDPTTWHQVVFAMQGGSGLFIYVDAALSGASPAPATGNFSATTDVAWSTVSPWLAHFGGVIDEVAIYPRTLAPATIQAHYRAAVGNGSGGCTRSLQSQIDAAGAGSLVNVPACIYREAVTVTKPLTLAGASGAEIRGSDVWNAWTANGATWSSQQAVPALPDSPNTDGRCPDNTHPRCTLAEQVFFDGQPLTILGIGVTPAAGQFALDSARHVVLGDNPSGHTVEVTTRQSWIRTTADGVTIQNFTMRHAGNDANIGAVSNDGHSNWSLEDSTLSDSHGPGVTLSQGQNIKVLRNEIRRGGNLGIGGDAFTQGVVQGNHIHDNNTDGVARSWGAAGMKTSRVRGLTVDGNEIDHNQADGLWCDADCQSVTYSNNRMHDNLGQGILFEVSDGGSIHDNVTWNNGWDGGVPGGYWVWHGGIVVSTSANVEVYNNTVAWNAEGISILHQNRPGNPTPPAPTGISVHDNVIVKKIVSNTNYWANMSLAWSDENNSGPQSMYDPGANNHAANNYYWYDQPADPNTARFFWIWGYSVLDNYVKNSPTTGDRYLSDTEMQQILSAKGVSPTPNGASKGSLSQARPGAR